MIDRVPFGDGNLTVAEAVAAMRAVKARYTAVLIIFTLVLMLAAARLAGLSVPGLTDRTVLHSGPPLAWERMSGPLRGAVIGAALFEGWATTAEEAERLAASGALAFDSCHHHRAVGPMAGMITRSMAVYVVRNEAFGTEAYATINMGQGRVLRMGAYDASVLERLAWMNRGLAPLLDDALARAGGVDAKSLIARALTMGDAGRRRAGARVHGRFGLVLPQHRDGRVQGHARRRPRHPRVHGRDGDGAQRHRLRHPRERDR